VDVFGLAVTVLLALLAAFAAAAWVAGGVWAYHDIRARTQDIYVQLFATLIVFLFGPFGAVLYLMLRPRERLDDAYLRMIQEEAILREMTGTGGGRSAPGLHAINGKFPTIGQDVFIAPGAQLIGDVRLGDRASVWYNAVIRGDIAPVIIGPGTNVQDGCVLHVDVDQPLRLGANVTVGHMAMLHGCTVEDDCLIGIQSTVLSGAVIRRSSIVGAAALVPEGKEFPERSLLLGLPAKPARELAEEQVQELIVERAAEYRELAAQELRARGQGTPAAPADAPQADEPRAQTEP
jgi:carbonic anhydrase/acetyltransferase-like protein (isoleucine patch superfamily)